MEKKIRWTITGESAPLENRQVTWSRVTGLVGEAERIGLRVEVVELDEEERDVQA